VSVEALDDADDVRRDATWRHEVDRAHTAVRGLELGLEDERVVPVPARVVRDLAARRQRPVAILGSAEERREARARIEAGKAAPVDRAAAVDERRRLEIPEQCVVLDPPHAT